MRTPILALALVLPLAAPAAALTVLDFPPPEGGYIGIRNREVYSIRGIVRAEDLDIAGNFVAQPAVVVNLDLSTFVDGDGYLFTSLNGFGPNAGLGGVLDAGLATVSFEFSFGPTSVGRYAGYDGSAPFNLSIGVRSATIGSPYEVNFAVNPLPAPALALLPALGGLGWLARRRRIV